MRTKKALMIIGLIIGFMGTAYGSLCVGDAEKCRGSNSTFFTVKLFTNEPDRRLWIICDGKTSHFQGCNKVQILICLSPNPNGLTKPINKHSRDYNAAALHADHFKRELMENCGVQSRIKQPCCTIGTNCYKQHSTICGQGS